MSAETRQGFGTKQVRAIRNIRIITSAPNISVGELETHYRRLQRVNVGNMWKRGFGGISAVLLGGVVGALLTGDGWTDEVKVAAAVAVVCLLAWYAIKDTESETIGAICEDYKQDIIDSIEFEEDAGQKEVSESLIRKGERSSEELA